MKNTKGNAIITSLTSNKRFLIVSSLILLLFVLYIAFFFRLTKSTVMNSIVALGVLLGIIGTLYYSVYRWLIPTLSINKWVLRLASGSMLGGGLGIWFFQKKSLSISILSTLDQFFHVLHSQPIEAYELFYPMVNFLFFIFVGTISYCLVSGIVEIIFRRIPLSYEKIIVTITYSFLLVSITTCFFCTDALQQGPGQKSIIYFGGTETYVTDRLENSLTFLQDMQKFGGFLNGRGPDGIFTVYESQTGFYSSILKLIQSITKINADDFVKGTRVLFAMFLSGMLTLLSISLKRKYGLFASVVFSIFPVTIFWFLGPASYLIWFYFILFIPFFVSIFIYPKVQLQKLTFNKLLWLIFASEVLVFLRGYTYFPELIASAAIPVFFYNLRDRKTFKEIFFNAFFICLVGLASLIIVLSIHYLQLGLFNKDFGEAFSYIYGRGLIRGATGDTNLMTATQIFQEWLKVNVFYIPPKFFEVFPQFEEGFQNINSLGNLHVFAFVLVGISMILKIFERALAKGSELCQKEINELFYFGLTTIVAMVVSWSWFPALGHMSHHFHMNGIMYMIPFGLTLFMFTGVFVQTLIRWGVVGLRPDKITQ